MATDPVRLEELARVLLNRADDLYYVGQELVRTGEGADWRCAKAVRYREAMRGRHHETIRLATQLRDLGRLLRLRSQKAMAAQSVAAPELGTLG